MKRPQRYLFIIMTVMVAIYLLLTRLPAAAALALLGAIAIYGLTLVLWGRDLLLGRRHSSRREWRKAIERYERFEKKLLKFAWPKLTVALYLGIYSLDGVAIARNGIAHSLLNAGDLDRAVPWLRSALQRDPYYPVPYVNLAVIAAKRGDEQTAVREMTKAVQLGFSPQNAQRILRKVLESPNDPANEGVR